MIFTVNYCKRKATRRRSPRRINCIRVFALVFAALVAVLLLLLAPQWLVVLLTVLLAAAVVALIRIKQ